MKVFYITNTILDGKSAAANHVVEMVNAMKCNGYNVTLLSAEKRLFNVCYRGGDIHFWFPKFRGGWRIFQLQLIVYLMVHDFSVSDSIYFRLSPSRLLSWFLKRVSAFKAMELNGLEISGNHGFSSLLDVADVIFVGTERTKNELIRLYPKKNKIYINSNVGVQVGRFGYRNKETCKKYIGFGDVDNLIVNVSGFQSHHDFDTLINSVKFLRCNFKNIKLLLIGDGPSKISVENKFRKFIDDGTVVFLGSVQLDDLPVFIGAADVCVNVMYNHKLIHHGNLNAQKTYEYMASGKPIIETCNFDITIPEWAKKRIILVRPESESDLVNAIKVFLTNKDRYENLARENILFIHEYYSWDIISRKALKTIEDVKSKNSVSSV